MDANIFVFGHRNPDNDSVCSATAYAWLKNAVATRAGEPACYEPVRLGEAPAETAWVFERAGLPLPRLLEDVKVRVGDVMTRDVAAVSTGDSLLEAGRTMAERGLRTLPVVDAEGRPAGVVTSEALAGRYLAGLAMPGFAERPISVRRLALALEGGVVTGDPEQVLSAGVVIAATEPDTLASLVGAGDVVVVGDRRRAQPLALEAGAGCLVVTGGATAFPAALEAAAATGAAIVTTGHDEHAAVRLVELAHAVDEVMAPAPVTVLADDLLAEVSGRMLASPQRSALVVDEGGALVGIVSRTDLAAARSRRVILVDHNETAQSAPGIETAEVVEVVDHHRIGDVQTAGPIAFHNLPVGATATVVESRFRELGVEVPAGIATVLLAAILTDTLLFKSPTTTDADRAAAERLGVLAQVAPLEFGMELLRARSAGTPFDARHAVTADLKRFIA